MRLVSALILASTLFAALPMSSARAACPVPMGGWGVAGSGPGEFNLPTTLVRDASNRWLVCDQHNSRIQVFDVSGAFLNSFGEGLLYHPSGITIGPNGLVYVADHQNHRVAVFTPAGALTQSIPAGDHPVGVTFDGGGNLYVGVTGAIRRYQLDGTFLVNIGMGIVSRPYGVRFGPDGNLWASDYGNHQVHVFTTAAGHVTSFGSFGTGPAQFRSCEQVLWGEDGRVYVADTGNDRVQVFTPGLVYDCEFGSTGSGPANLDVPTDLAWDAQGRIVVVDYLNNRIRIWGFPPVNTVATTWGALKQIYR